MTADRPTEDVSWAEDPQAETSEPVGERRRGWPFQYAPPAEQKNWLQRSVGRWIDYLGQGGRFESLPELIDALDVGGTSTLAPENPYRIAEDAPIYTTENEINAIDSDGKRIFWREGTTVFAYDIAENSMADVEIPGDPPPPGEGRDSLQTNGDVVTVSYGDGDGAGLVALACDGLEKRWENTFSGDTNGVTIEGHALVGGSVYITVDEETESNITFRLSTQDGAPIDSTSAPSDAVIIAANGQFTALQSGSELILRDDRLFEEWWTSTVGTGPAFVAAMDGRSLYVSSVEEGTLVYPLATAAEPDPLTATAEFGIIQLDDERAFLSPLAGDLTRALSYEIKNFDMSVRWDLLPRVTLDTDATEIALAGDKVALAVDRAAAGDYAIYLISKGDAPKIYRRFDPTDDRGMWHGLLAAPA